MPDIFSVKSTSSNRALVFSKFDGENYYVELSGGVTTQIKVYAYSPHSHSLAEWFSELGLHRVPWQGEKVWESLEGELKITSECSPLGHVYFTIYLRELLGGFEDFYVQAGLESELGQLPKISKEADKFFATKRT